MLLENIEQLAQLTIKEILTAYQDQSLSPVQVHEMTLAQIEQVNPAINALYDVDVDEVKAAGQASATRWKNNTRIGALDGIPISIKDSIHAVGKTWHHGSAAHGKGVVGTEDAPPTMKLKQAKATILAKCTMPDYGMSASGVSSYHGIIRNPWNLTYSPGGSSAGAGASLAAGIGICSIGSDIAGSVRLPASHCGLAALKTTQGMIAHTPASDIRSAGIMTRNAQDLEIVLRALGGVHAQDRFSVPVIDMPEQKQITLKVYDNFGFGPEVEQSVLHVLHEVVEAIGGQGYDMIPGDLRYSFDMYAPIDDLFKIRAFNEYQRAHEQYRDLTNSHIIAWCKEAQDWTISKYLEIQAGIAKGIEETQKLFGDADYLITPVMPVVNFPAEQLGPDESMPLRHTTFTAPFNQSGHPAVVICGGFDERGLPVGVQLVGKRFSDIHLIRLACEIEKIIRAKQGKIQWPTQLQKEKNNENKLCFA